MTLPTYAEFASELHPDRSPYAWQRRAAAELAQDGWWPAVRAPTGSGKTTLIDCWLYALASAGPDGLGRRLVWVVDRRSVVDQIYAYASAVVARLVEAGRDGPVGHVAARLEQIGGGARPAAVLWRGGLDDEGSIAMRDPLEPAAVAVVVSTVDQVGSRLLFRGYGMGAGSRALHAGLLGVDTTVVVDEAHIAEPLRRTVARVGELQRAAPSAPRPAIRLCAVSATHSADGAFELRPEERQEPAIRDRLTATKPAILAQPIRPAHVVKHVGALLGGDASFVGVVMNTVAAARQVFDTLLTVAPEEITDRVLLIGPVRPLERLDLLGAVTEERGDRPLVVVATQTIEVGMDLDFDALITECAPLDALVQRFGRLNRSGRSIAAPGVILPPPARGCPVYGDDAAATWTWLTQVAQPGSIVDLGIEALRESVAVHGSPTAPSPVRTIALHPAHVSALEVTDATDVEGPAIELFLHGDRAAAPQVSLFWRALPGGTHSDAHQVEKELELRPLHSGEAVTISFAAGQRWIAGAVPGVESDLEAGGEDVGPRGDQDERKAAWRVDVQGMVFAVGDDQPLRPGDRVVIDVSAGGLDGFGWSPSSKTSVIDLGSISGRAPRIVLGSVNGDRPEQLDTVLELLEAGDMTPREAAAALGSVMRSSLPLAGDRRPMLAKEVAKAAKLLEAGRAASLGDGRVLVTSRAVRTEHSGRGGIVTLADHQRAVADRVARTATAVGLVGALRDSLEVAAKHHDEGKRDERFQRWLRGGAPEPGEALAKGVHAYDAARVRRLREAAGWPAGKRHEMVSAVFVALAHPDDELAAWLVATHHGRNRPFPLAVDDADAGTVRIFEGGDDPLDVPGEATPSMTRQLEALATFGERLGAWGLAYLEALLISADRTVSAQEARA